MTPERVTVCPCGKTDLEKLYAKDESVKRRESCLDPVPTCGAVCGRKLDNCGHACESVCHEGPCPPCLLTSGKKSISFRKIAGCSATRFMEPGQNKSGLFGCWILQNCL